MEVDCVFLGNFANGIIVQMSHDMVGLPSHAFLLQQHFPSA